MVSFKKVEWCTQIGHNIITINWRQACLWCPIGMLYRMKHLIKYLLCAKCWFNYCKERHQRKRKHTPRPQGPYSSEREREKRHSWKNRSSQFNHEKQPTSHAKFSTNCLAAQADIVPQGNPRTATSGGCSWKGYEQRHMRAYSSYSTNGIFKKGWPRSAYFSGLMFPHSLVPIWDSRINKLLKVSQLHLQAQGLPTFAQNVSHLCKAFDSLPHTLNVSNSCSFFKTQLMLFQEAFPDSYS